MAWPGARPLGLASTFVPCPSPAARRPELAAATVTRIRWPLARAPGYSAAAWRSAWAHWLAAAAAAAAAAAPPDEQPALATTQLSVASTWPGEKPRLFQGRKGALSILFGTESVRLGRVSTH